MMNNQLIYLIQTGGCFFILYLVYWCFFRQLTFHQINRVLLLLIIPLSLFLPFIAPVFPGLVTAETLVIPDFDILVLEVENVGREALSTDLGFQDTLLPLIPLLYWLGVMIGLFRLVLGLLKLWRLKRRATAYHENGYQILEADIPHIFSCFRWIFIPRGKRPQYEDAVMAHEMAHVRFGHTLDLLITEIYISFWWFNPLVYGYRRSVRSLHEFQADQAAMGGRMKKSDYLALLLHNLGKDGHAGLFSYFNHPIIKKRIDMITKTNSSKKALLMYVLLIPVMAVLSMAFTTTQSPVDLQISSTFSLVEEADPPSIFPIQKGTARDITAAFGKTFAHPVNKEKVVHNGIDIRAAKGTPVLATADGKVLFAQEKDNWGNLIILTHADGFETRYAHLEGFNVEANQSVKKGQVIGFVGNSGLSSGPHLHYEVSRNGDRLNPMDFVER